MSKRLDKARRVLTAQIELDRLADWMLEDTGRREAAAAEQYRKLAGFLEAESAFGGLFADVLIQRLHALERTCAALRREREAQAETRLAERARMRGAEAIVGTLEEDKRRREEQLQLDEAIAASLSGPR